MDWFEGNSGAVDIEIGFRPLNIGDFPIIQFYQTLSNQQMVAEYGLKKR